MTKTAQTRREVRKDHHRFSRTVTRTARWRVLRMSILEREGFKCRECGARGRLEVDHIKPVRTHPDLAYAPENLQVLCPGCHTRKTRVECGHPPPREDRRDWRDCIADLERQGTGKPPSKGNQSANLCDHRPAAKRNPPATVDSGR